MEEKLKLLPEHVLSSFVSVLPGKKLGINDPSFLSLPVPVPENGKANVREGILCENCANITRRCSGL